MCVRICVAYSNTQYFLWASSGNSSIWRNGYNRTLAHVKRSQSIFIVHVKVKGSGSVKEKWLLGIAGSVQTMWARTCSVILRACVSFQARMIYTAVNVCRCSVASDPCIYRACKQAPVRKAERYVQWRMVNWLLSSCTVSTCTLFIATIDKEYLILYSAPHR